MRYRAISLAAIFVASLLCFGGVANPFESIYPFLVFVFGVSFIFTRNSERTEEYVSFPHQKLASILICCVVAGFIFQTIPLPQALLHWLSPISYEFRISLLQKLGFAKVPSFFPVSLAPEATREAVVQMISFVILFVGALEIFADHNVLHFWAISLSVIGAIVSVFGMAHRFFGSTKVYGLFERGATFFGPYLNLNHAGAFLAITSAITLGLLYRESERHRRISFSLVLAATILGMFFTGSRAATLSFGCALAALLFRRGRTITPDRVITRYALPVFVGIVIIAAFWKAAFISRALSTVTGQQAPPEFRLKFWKYALQMFSHAPLLGVGPGAYSLLSPSYVGSAYFLHPEHTENDFLETLACGGLFIFCLCSILLYFPIRQSANLLIKSSREVSLTRRTYALGFIALLVNMGFVFHLPLIAHQILAAFLIAGVLGSSKYSPLNSPRTKPLLLLGLALLLVLHILNLSQRTIASDFSTDSKESRSSAANLAAQQILGQAIAEEKLAREPIQSEPLYLWANSQAALGDMDRAKVAFEQARRLNPFDLHQTTTFIHLLWNHGERDGAKKILDELLEGSSPIPDHARINLHLDDMIYSYSDTNQTAALRHLSRAEKIDPKNWKVLMAKSLMEPNAVGLISQSWSQFSNLQNPVDAWDLAFFSFMKFLRIKTPQPWINELSRNRNDIGKLLAQAGHFYPDLRDMLWVTLDHAIPSPRLKANNAVAERNAYWNPIENQEGGPEVISIRVKQSQPELDIYYLPTQLSITPKTLSIRMRVQSVVPLSKQLFVQTDGVKWHATPTEAVRTDDGAWELVFLDVGSSVEGTAITGIGFSPLEHDGRYAIGPIEAFVDLTP